MKVDELRAKYLEYFKNKGHKVFASDSLVPDDPTVLFTSAGMNQFKPYFMGEKKDVKRATSCQKCLRTGDLDNVGKTPCHHTFFEMLGNFSFGDYFKKEAIEFGWEFLTKELNIKPADLQISVYEKDEEAYGIWLDHIGIPPEKIIRFGEKDNFWPSQAPSLGPNGPCGPCSEIYFDRKIGCGKDDCSPACDCRRFVEVWNLVFTQFNRVALNQLEPLPQKNIDTGMGLERMAAMMQGKESNFEIDNLAPIVAEVRKIAKNNNDAGSQGMINAIVDHARAVSFCICDGVYPSNEDRGYVVRKIIRKAVFNGHLLGVKEAFLFRLPALVAQLMGKTYPELNVRLDTVTKVVRAEEDKFLSTLNSGREQFSTIVNGLKTSGHKTVKAQDLFKLYDTYGFPLELSKDMAVRENLNIDEAGFDKLFSEQQTRSRTSSKFDGAVFNADSPLLQKIKNLPCQFFGYDNCALDSEIVFMVKGADEVTRLSTGEEGIIFLSKSVFYAESGGQLCDKGTIRTPSGEFLVEEVNKIGEVIAHRGRVNKGEISKSESAAGCVDMKRRKSLMRAHTATHLLQAALRGILGDHVAQQGSLVDSDRLRFDFTHFSALTKDELKNIEAQVNARIFDGIKVDKRVLSLDEAKKQGALAFFKDKYKDEVRTVFISDFSKELCGGTHLDNTIEAGLFVIINESSIASGVRRIEALTGFKAWQYLQDTAQSAKISAAALNCQVVGLPAALERLQSELKSAEQKIDNLNHMAVLQKTGTVMQGKENAAGIDFVVFDFGAASKDELMHAWDDMKKQGNLFAFLCSAANKFYICATTDDMLSRGISCKKFLSDYSAKLGIKGGGRDNLVQGAIQNVNLAEIKEAIKGFIVKS
jgi:alanyl-tRNA synthetase